MDKQHDEFGEQQRTTLKTQQFTGGGGGEASAQNKRGGQGQNKPQPSVQC